MNRRIAQAIIILTASITIFNAQPASAASAYRVLSVVDGDTIRINYGGRSTYVRLIGIDAPETSSKSNTKKGCYATQAKNYLARRLVGRYITLRSDSLSGNLDYYGRLLRYVYLGGENINYTLVANGYAREYKYWSSNYWSRLSHLFAQSWAKSHKRGLWNPAICQMNG